jgi:hypothetical protein
MPVTRILTHLTVDIKLHLVHSAFDRNTWSREMSFVIRSVALVMASLATSFAASAASPSPSVTSTVQGEAFAKELTANAVSAAAERRALALELAPVKSLADFHTQIQQINPGASAFRKLSAADQAAFANSLTFNARGVTSFNYKVLEDSLTVHDAYQFLSLFGVQHVVKTLRGLRVESASDLRIRKAEISPLEGLEESGDRHNYWCSSNATCSPRGNDICTGNC